MERVGKPPRLPVVLNHTNAGFIIIDTRVTGASDEHKPFKNIPNKLFNLLNVLLNVYVP